MKILSAEFARGIRGTDPILSDTKKHIAFAGRSNVGKSSVLNALLGRRDLAHSSSTPGKTTEINLYLVNERFYLADLPGYGYAQVRDKEKEKLVKMILWYLLESGAPVAHTFVVIDASVGATDRDLEMMRALDEQGVRFSIIGNKTDKIKKSGRREALAKLSAQLDPHPFFPFSATDKEGMENVLRVIEEHI